MKREQFEQEYAQRSGVTIQWLDAHDFVARPCPCEASYCAGWMMVHLRELRWAEEAGVATPYELDLLYDRVRPPTRRRRLRRWLTYTLPVPRWAFIVINLFNAFTVVLYVLRAAIW